VKEFKEGAIELVEKIKEYKPKVVCFNGMGIYQAVTNLPKVRHCHVLD
jgi:hypothetical protein